MKTTPYHVIALLVITVWGTTFVATTLLLHNGLSPRDIFFFRFLLAYIGIWFFGPRRLFANNLKDEFLLMLIGITGGSLYFMAGNTALGITQASNVALLACTAPVLTIIISRLFLKKESPAESQETPDQSGAASPVRRLKKNRFLWQGSFLALIGVALVIFNGQVILQVNPLGDMFGLLAAFSWALYTILLKRLSTRYSMLFITRKTFFYGLLTLLPLFLYRPLNVNTVLLMHPVIRGNFLYLGLMASLFCYFLWNIVVKKLGAVRANNYVYLSPIITMAASALILNETITIMAIIGAMLILLGVALAER